MPICSRTEHKPVRRRPRRTAGLEGAADAQDDSFNRNPGVVAALSPTACGSGNSSSPGGGSSGVRRRHGRLQPRPRRPAGRRCRKAVDLGKATGKVGVILPDTTSSTRYTLYDKPLLKKALTAAGITPDIQNAQATRTSSPRSPRA